MYDEDIIIGDAGGFATVIVMKSDKFIAANFGKYKAVVVCRNGMASQIGWTYQIIERGWWPISGTQINTQISKLGCKIIIYFFFGFCLSDDQ